MDCLHHLMNIRTEPFLWIHLTGIALFPAFVGLTLIALAVGDSFSYMVELPLLAAIAILPVLVMQLIRPFDIFSVLFFSLKPEYLSEEQRQILALFKTFKQQLTSIIAALLMLVILWLLYRLSSLAIGITDFLPQWRIAGLAIASFTYLLANLFFQVPLSVLLVLTAKESKLVNVEPCSIAEIEHNFTVPGIKVSKILWFLESRSETENKVEKV